MFGGLLAMIAVSFLVYRRAGANQRRRSLWVLLLWVLAMGGAIAAEILAMIMNYIRHVEFATEREEMYALVLPAGMGMAVGAVVCVWLAGRKTEVAN